MHKKWIAFVAWLAITALFSIASLQTPQAQPPDDLARAVAAALRASPTFGNTAFAITAVHLEGDWALVSVGALEGPAVVEGYIGTQESGRLLLASRTNGVWQVSIEGDSVFAKLLAQAPDALVSPQAKALLTPKAITSPAGANSAQTVSYKWPWAAGRSWRWLQGWHARALDIGTDGADRRILASADGVVTYVCKGSLGAALKVRDADGVVLEYWHIDSARLSGAVQLGATVTQGQWLGTLRPGTWTDNTACGTQYTSQNANSAHVHWVLPTDRTFTVEGWSITSPNSTLANGTESRTCNGGCWGSAFFFTSSNQSSDEPNPSTSTSTSTIPPTPTATSTPEVTASLSIEPASLITQAGRLITLSVMLNVAGPVDAAAVAFRLSYDPDLARIERLTSTEALTDVVISNTLSGATFAGTLITTTLQQAAGPIASLTLSTTAVGSSAVSLTSATLIDRSGNALTPTLRNSLILAVAEWPAPRVYLPFVTRDTANEIAPTATPRLTAISTFTPTSTITFTSTSTSMPTESSTSTSTISSTTTATNIPIDTQTPTPTSTLVDGR